MSLTTLALTAALLLAAPGEARQDRSEIRDLIKGAQAVSKAGNNSAEARQPLARAWAHTAQLYHPQGDADSSRKAWDKAVVHDGWEGTPPFAEAAPPPSRRVQERPPARRPAPRASQRRRRRPSANQLWMDTARGPYRAKRSHGVHGFFNTPSLEDALLLPARVFHASATVQMATVDWSSNKEGGESKFHTALITEALELDYGVASWLEAGIRVTLGELRESDDDIFRVFEGGNQIVPTGTRGFGLESITGRVKLAFRTSVVDFGILTEFKAPLADEDDYLTAQTMDAAVSGLLSRQWGVFALHVNAGMVIPIGDADLFLSNDDVDSFLHGGVAATLRVASSFSLFGQLHFNSSAFGDVTVLDEPVMAALFGGRFRAGRSVMFGGGVGLGLTEESGDTSFTGSVDFFF